MNPQSKPKTYTRTLLCHYLLCHLGNYEEEKVVGGGVGLRVV